MTDVACICPVVEIRDSGDFVTEAMMLKIARDLRATVTLSNPKSHRTVFGKHLMTCPCWTRSSEGFKAGLCVGRFGTNSDGCTKCGLSRADHGEAQ